MAGGIKNKETIHEALSALSDELDLLSALLGDVPVRDKTTSGDVPDLSAL